MKEWGSARGVGLGNWGLIIILVSAGFVIGTCPAKR
jgi:hypothetical protein